MNKSRVAAGLVIFALLVTVGVVLGFQFDGRMRGDSATTAPAPDPQVTWETFPVTGLFLCKRTDPTDSTKVECLPMPAGSLLLVPHVVPPDGRTPADGTSTR